jgi:hypothetical protein
MHHYHYHHLYHINCHIPSLIITQQRIYHHHHHSIDFSRRADEDEYHRDQAEKQTEGQHYIGAVECR